MSETRVSFSLLSQLHPQAVSARGGPRFQVSSSLLMIPAETVPTSRRGALGHRLMPGPVALARGWSTQVRDGVHGHKMDLRVEDGIPRENGGPPAGLGRRSLPAPPL